MDGVETFPLPQRRRVAGLAFGSMRSIRRGSGSDVAGSRPYLPGDDIRTIDRAASARLSSAHARDEWVVRQTYADEAARVVVAADRQPSMRLFPDGLPWLRKPQALAETVALVCRSAAAAACVTGFLADDGDPEPVWLAPGRATGEELTAAARRGAFRAPEDALDRALDFLALRARLPTGSFVFLVSDFLRPLGPEALGEALAHRWELVPVVVQDPVWERSFPDVAGALLPLADPATGRTRHVRLTRREVRELREAHELRWAETLDRLESLDLDPVVLDAHDPERILDAFQAWSGRSAGVGGRL
ncbi:MAG TPA: DUF58 domain-containing protein [Gaiellaceae bacterium]|nr:DUF58 domain-containing protein [Gaiellaceae bacterium]